MPLRFLHVHIALLVLAVSACSDAPTSPSMRPDAGASLGGMYPLTPGEGECDPWLDANWCEDSNPGNPGGGPGECLEGSLDTEGGVHSCWVGGGGGDPDMDDEPAADTCDTGDPVIDDPEMSAGFQDLWMRSKADANLAQRVEQAGWIVQTSTGYSIVRWTGGTQGFSCGQFDVTLPTTGAVVGFIHTHPYRVDEAIVDCQFRGVQAYDGGPSEADRFASEQLGQFVGSSASLPGYIMDKDGFYRFDGQSNTASPRRPRCAY